MAFDGKIKVPASNFFKRICMEIGLVADVQSGSNVTNLVHILDAILTKRKSQNCLQWLGLRSGWIFEIHVEDAQCMTVDPFYRREQGSASPNPRF